MKKINYLVSTLFFFSFIIFVGIGHGVAHLGLMELSLIPSLLSFNLSSSGKEEILLSIFILIALCGHILLFLSLRRKKYRQKLILITFGQIMLLSTIIFLCSGFLENSTARFTLFWSVPALINMAFLTFDLYFYKKEDSTN